jgi:hypothetical protein
MTAQNPTYTPTFRRKGNRKLEAPPGANGAGPVAAFSLPPDLRGPLPALTRPFTLDPP